MRKRPQTVESRIAVILKTWEDIAPEAKFAGMTLAEYRLAVNPSLEIRSGMETKRNELRGAISARKSADAASHALSKRVVHSILAEAAYGPNSPLYRALKYVPESENRSGRATKQVTATTPSPTTEAPSAN